MIKDNIFIKIGLILEMIIALLLLISCVIYGILTFFNYFSLTIILIIIYGLFQLIPFSFSLNNYFNEEKWLFVTGLISLLTFVIPGILILIGYFLRQNQLLINLMK